jgi:hypothetical protein
MPTPTFPYTWQYNNQPIEVLGQNLSLVTPGIRPYKSWTVRLYANGPISPYEPVYVGKVFENTLDSPVIIENSSILQGKVDIKCPDFKFDQNGESNFTVHGKFGLCGTMYEVDPMMMKFIGLRVSAYGAPTPQDPYAFPVIELLSQEYDAITNTVTTVEFLTVTNLFDIEIRVYN